MKEIFFIFFFIQPAWFHGYLSEPPGRSSLWRYREFDPYDPPVNYNDNELYCGGREVQHSQNGGKCGVCGDNWNQPQPRDNEGGGKYGRGVIARVYNQGQVVPVSINLTTSHLGYFELRICPHNSPFTPADDECLDKYKLKLADGSGTKVQVKETGVYHTSVQLPNDLLCSQCVFSWVYTAGNNPGTDRQETFKSCADVAVIQPRILHVDEF